MTEAVLALLEGWFILHFCKQGVRDDVFLRSGVNLEACDVSCLRCYVCVDGVSIVFAAGYDVEEECVVFSVFPQTVDCSVIPLCHAYLCPAVLLMTV